MQILILTLTLLLTLSPTQGTFPSTTTRNITLCAYNPQIWGVSKASKLDVVNTTANMLVSYDLIFFQEIRDASQTAIFDLLSALNDRMTNPDHPAYPASSSPPPELGGCRYDMAMSPRQGRTSSKEQSAYIFRNCSLAILAASVFAESELPPPLTNVDVFEREPYVARFRVRGLVSQDYLPDPPPGSIPVPETAQEGLLIMVGIHVKPSDALFENGNLSAVASQIDGPVIIGGDLNADCSYLNQGEAQCCVPLFTDPDYDWLIPFGQDTTVKSTTCAYDRWIVHTDYGPFTVPVDSPADYVYDFPAVLNLDQDFAEDVSDHYPIILPLSYPIPPSLIANQTSPPPPTSSQLGTDSASPPSVAATLFIVVISAAVLLLLVIALTVALYIFPSLRSTLRSTLHKLRSTPTSRHDISMQAYA